MHLEPSTSWLLEAIWQIDLLAWQVRSQQEAERPLWLYRHLHQCPKRNVVSGAWFQWLVPKECKSASDLPRFHHLRSLLLLKLFCLRTLPPTSSHSHDRIYHVAVLGLAIALTSLGTLAQHHRHQIYLLQARGFAVFGTLLVSPMGIWLSDYVAVFCPWPMIADGLPWSLTNRIVRFGQKKLWSLKFALSKRNNIISATQHKHSTLASRTCIQFVASYYDNRHVYVLGSMPPRMSLPCASVSAVCC